jgi:putative SOS response-associated peptidase YedK
LKSADSRAGMGVEPDNVEYMFIPTLWDIWEKDGSPVLYSAALITDEPAPEISAAGHDRTPIFLKESAIDAWLNAKETSVKDLGYVLDQREHPHYSHALVGVA